MARKNMKLINAINALHDALSDILEAKPDMQLLEGMYDNGHLRTEALSAISKSFKALESKDTFPACIERHVGKDKRSKRIVKLAHDEHHVDGEVEVDQNSVVSEGDDNGAYVMAWVWVSFADHEGLDKEAT